uniref:Reverse transcriptase domain-containing protein n=1 Tax=Anopheles minimus TaxID=112268 RepID=A0A182W5U5_9DIPT
MAAFPAVFRRTFQHYIDAGIFPEEWKRQRLDPSSYRPICLLSVLDKVLERLIQRRLKAHLESTGGFADGEYGFRKGRSTMDAITRLDGDWTDYETDEGIVSRSVSASVPRNGKRVQRGGANVLN